MAKMKRQAIRDKEFAQLQRRATKVAEDLKAVESEQLHLHRELQKWAKKRGVNPISRTTVHAISGTPIIGTKLGFCRHLGCIPMKVGNDFCWPVNCSVVGNKVHCKFQCYPAGEGVPA
jgi:hypothetical protein